MEQQASIGHNGASVLEIVDFIITHMGMYSGREREIEKVVRKSLEYNTGDYGVDNKGILYVLRYNIFDSEAEVTDLVIRPDHRGKIKLLKYIIGRNWAKWPHLKTIRFGRYAKYPMRAEHKYKLINFFKKEK